ncbi:corticotropin-releasing factor-binding protein-like [Uloborus diversus]|uniref:corticotropin-releasing factor-binding protein-like n=1 Tax=Uloborus diversus TaxID=327109 RepID=UPI00240A026B|nr:corticotropin-releasing factor-binding protein-like [Uloborus diversus]
MIVFFIILAVTGCNWLKGAFGNPLLQFDESMLEDELNLRENVQQLQVDETGQCIFVKSEEGLYSFRSDGTSEDQVCGLYLIARPDQKVELEFKSFDISCTKGGLLSVIDGWELNGQFFPSPIDHPKPEEERYREFCGRNKPRKSFHASQNVGLVEFRIPTKGQGFTVHVRFRDNLKPCNVVLQEPQGTYTLRNSGRQSNCSVSVIFPLSINLLSVSIGVQRSGRQRTREFETGLFSKCGKSGLRDWMEIRGGDGLDPQMMRVATDFCGVSKMPRSRPVSVACGNTAVRLVSSGRYDNSVTFTFDIPADFSDLDLVCPNFFGALEL